MSTRIDETYGLLDGVRLQAELRDGLLQHSAGVLRAAVGAVAEVIADPVALPAHRSEGPQRQHGDWPSRRSGMCPSKAKEGKGYRGGK